jgi:hypothetical protein
MMDKIYLSAVPRDKQKKKQADKTKSIHKETRAGLMRMRLIFLGNRTLKFTKATINL